MKLTDLEHIRLGFYLAVTFSAQITFISSFTAK